MPETMDDPIITKVLIFATSVRGLLVFDQPDDPGMPLQVPGGTVEPGESPEAAARRELQEETGILARDPPRLLGTTDYAFTKGARRILHRRSVFHLPLPDDLPDVWHHLERTPDGGGGPLRFRLFWIGTDEAQARLGFGMATFLDRLPRLVPDRPAIRPATSGD